MNIVNQSNRIQFAGDYIHAERKILLNAQAALFSKTIPAAFRQKLVKGLHVDSNIDFKGAYFWDKKELQDAELNGDFSLFYMPDKKIKIHCKPIIK